MVFVVAAFMLYGPIKRLSRVNTNIQQAIAASERIFEILDTHSEVAEREGARAARIACARRSNSIASASSTEDGSGRSVLEGRQLHCARPDRWLRSSASAERARPRSSTCYRASTTCRAGAIRIDGPGHPRCDDPIASQQRSAWSRRRRCCSTTTIANNIAYGSPQASTRRDRAGGARRTRARVHRRSARRLRDLHRRAGAAKSRGASGSASRSPAPCSRTRRSSSSTRRRRRSMRNQNDSSRKRSRT